MTGEHPLTDHDVRVYYVEYAQEVFHAWNPGQPEPPAEEFSAPYDAWLAEHDARIRAECAQKARELGTAMREADGWDEEWSTREVRDALNIAADKIDGTREWE